MGIDNHLLLTVALPFVFGGVALAFAKMQMAKLKSALASSEKARRTAEAAAQEKARTLATMSHEVRTPLNGIIGMTSLLAETGLTASQSNYVKTAESSARTLLSVVDEILDQARNEHRSAEAKPTDLVALIESVTELLSPRAHAKGLEISSHVAPALTAQVQLEELRLRQIILNLAGNAIKFTHKGGIAIDADIGTAGKLEIRITDTGIGMKDEEQKRLFTEFAQANAETSKLYGGTGLGLAISRRLAREMGGDITVASKPHKGTTFTVTLPFGASSYEAAHSSALAGRHYVLALPPGFARNHLSKTLQEFGATISLCANTSALKNELAHPQNMRQLIVATRHARSLRAWAKRVKQSRRERAVVWVMLRAEERKHHADFLKAPFAGYLLNPLRRTSLLSYLSAHDGALLRQTSLRLRRSTKTTDRKKPKPKRLAVLVAEDNAINALLTRTMLERAGHSVKVAKDGLAALAILRKAKHFDAALLDMEMPKLSGLGVAKTLRNNSEFNHRANLPLVALTANSDRDAKVDCYAAGINAHLTKPFDKVDLEEILLKLTAKPKAA